MYTCCDLDYLSHGVMAEFTWWVPVVPPASLWPLLEEMKIHLFRPDRWMESTYDICGIPLSTLLKDRCTLLPFRNSAAHFSGTLRSPGVKLAYWTDDLVSRTEYYTGRVIIIHSVL